MAGIDFGQAQLSADLREIRLLAAESAVALREVVAAGGSTGVLAGQSSGIGLLSGGASGSATPLGLQTTPRSSTPFGAGAAIQAEERATAGLRLGKIKSYASKSFRIANNLFIAAELSGLLDQNNNGDQEPIDSFVGLARQNEEARRKGDSTRSTVNAVAGIVSLFGPLGQIGAAVGRIVADKIIDTGTTLVNQAEAKSNLADFVRKNYLGAGLPSYKFTDKIMDKFGGDAEDATKGLQKALELRDKGYEAASQGDVGRAQKEFDKATKATRGISVTTKFGTPGEIFLRSERTRHLKAVYTSWENSRSYLRTGD